MGTRVNHYFRRQELDSSASPIAITDAYGNVAALALLNEAGAAFTFRGRVETLLVRLENISAESEIEVRVTYDDQGDIVLLPDTTATLSFGVATTDTGTGVIEYGVPLVLPPSLTELTVFVRFTTAGVTGDLVYTTLTWSE